MCRNRPVNWLSVAHGTTAARLRLTVSMLRPLQIRNIKFILKSEVNHTHALDVLLFDLEENSQSTQCATQMRNEVEKAKQIFCGQLIFRLYHPIPSLFAIRSCNTNAIFTLTISYELLHLTHANKTHDIVLRLYYLGSQNRKGLIWCVCSTSMYCQTAFRPHQFAYEFSNSSFRSRRSAFLLSSRAIPAFVSFFAADKSFNLYFGAVNLRN